MDAVVVEDALGMVRVSGQIALGELRPEAGGFNQFHGGNMIRMGVDPIRRKKPARPKLGDRACVVVKWVDGTMLDTVWQVS